MFNPILTRFTAALALVLANSCSFAQTIILGAEDDWYPYSGVIDGKATGFAEDIITAAFKSAGIEVKFLSVPYSRCMAETRAGILLGCFDVARNSLLEPSFLWHRKPLYFASINIYASIDSKESGMRPGDLEGKEVGVTNTYEYGEEFDTDKKIKKVASNRDIQGFRKLIAGRIKYMVAYEKVAHYLSDRYSGELAGKIKVVGKTSTPGLYIAFSKSFPDSANIVEKFNEGFDAISRNGQYNLIEEKWH